MFLLVGTVYSLAVKLTYNDMNFTSDISGDLFSREK
jgi:hypothetical protein